MLQNELGLFNLQHIFYLRMLVSIKFSKLMLDANRKEGNVLFNDTLNTFYFTVIWRRWVLTMTSYSVVIAGSEHPGYTVV